MCRHATSSFASSQPADALYRPWISILTARLAHVCPSPAPEVLRRLLAYLGALPEALREYDRSHQSHGKGNVRITLEPGRKNLLRLRE
jgi:hypothetical protein